LDFDFSDLFGHVKINKIPKQENHKLFNGRNGRNAKALFYLQKYSAAINRNWKQQKLQAIEPVSMDKPNSEEGKKHTFCGIENSFEDIVEHIFESLDAESRKIVISFLKHDVIGKSADTSSCESVDIRFAMTFLV